ncbi:MAG: hypothetical protein CMJ83_15860 [Planctomycetes bacterium]|nr:hypothetical protein [Planctomycetota bacterium]
MIGPMTPRTLLAVAITTIVCLSDGRAVTPQQEPSRLEIAGQERSPSKWRSYVERCLSTLIAHGRDHYGPVKSPLLMAVIDSRTLTSPEEPELFASLIRLEEGRLHRRGERGSNPWYDQATIRSLYRMSELTGNAEYRKAADAYLAYFLKHCRKRRDDQNVYHNGMPAWGTHIYWDCYRDRPGGDLDGAGPHEILVYHPEWAQMQRLDAKRVREIVDGIWNWHIVDKKTGQHNRHDDARAGCDFAFSGGSFVLAFAFMHRASKEAAFLDRALLVANWHWQHRDRKTGLVPDAPSTGARYDAKHCMTCVTGPFASQLLRAYEISGERRLFDMAASYIKAYDAHGWDEKRGSYHGMLALDGTPVGGGLELDRTGKPIPGQTRKDQSNYGAWAPSGLVDIWRTAIYSYEFPLVAAQAAVYAYELSKSGGHAGDPALLRTANRWARAIGNDLPPRTGRRWKRELEEAMPAAAKTGGTYAENYGRAISFYVHLARATGETKHLAQAESLAQEAVTKLFRNGLFCGHPAKPYYESTSGVGILLYALLELDSPAESLRGAF